MTIEKLAQLLHDEARTWTEQQNQTQQWQMTPLQPFENIDPRIQARYRHVACAVLKALEADCRA